MKYRGESDYKHGSETTAGVLLVNLGTPDAPTTAALRRYLAEFLWDPRVVEIPRPIWWLILHGVILNIRPRKSAATYQRVWRNDGSPLLAITRQQRKALSDRLECRFSGRVKVEFAMRYGKPSIRSALEALSRAHARRVLVLPLYPQYSATTTACTFDGVADVMKSWRWMPELRFINDYCDDDAYIEAATQRINSHWEENGRSDCLLFSFHGLPKRYLISGDPYHCQCHKTGRLIAQRLGLKHDQWQLSFQSRLGREEWLQPYTDYIIKHLPKQGIKSVDVFCPGFAADCLETLEEIAMLNREFFIEAGGERFNYIPALNDMPAHIEALETLILRHMEGWPEVRLDWDQEQAEQGYVNSKKRALAMGAKQ
jgi:protoporphyrin/coproporphyrin ferrochelatase